MDFVYVGALCWLLLLFISNITCSHDCHPIDQCSCKLDNGQKINLWEIDKGAGEGYRTSDTLSRGFTYYYSPCTGLKSPNTECDGALGCQEVGSDSFAFALNTGPVSTAYDTKTKSYQFIYSGTGTKLSFNRVTTITLACDPQRQAPTIGSVLEQPKGHYAFTVTTKCACPGQCTVSSSKSKSKLSTGSILVIVFFVLLIVYIIGGLVINKYALHKEGSEIVPNKEFWKDLPSLIKDGYMFTYHKVSGNKKDYQVMS